MRDAFPPPMCCVDCLRVSFGWITYGTVDVVEGGLRVNGYLVWVGLRDKILRSVVGAVPVCPPVSPCKGASIVKSSCMIRDA